MNGKQKRKLGKCRFALFHWINSFLNSSYNGKIRTKIHGHALKIYVDGYNYISVTLSGEKVFTARRTTLNVKVRNHGKWLGYQHMGGYKPDGSFKISEPDSLECIEKHLLDRVGIAVKIEREVFMSRAFWEGYNGVAPVSNLPWRHKRSVHRKLGEAYAAKNR